MPRIDVSGLKGANGSKRPYTPLERLKVPKSDKWREREARRDPSAPARRGRGGGEARERRAVPERSAPEIHRRPAKAPSGVAAFRINTLERLEFPPPAREASSGKDSPRGSKGGGAGGRVLLDAVKGGTRFLRRGLSLLLIAAGSALVLLIVSALCVYAYLYFSESDYFMIKRFDIRGISKVSRAQILSASGLDRPVNAITFDTVAAVRSLKSLPWIEDAEISRTPPPDGVTIRVREYKARAVVNLEQLYYIDQEGRPFKNLEPGEDPDFPVVSGFTLDELLEGGPLVKSQVLEVFELMDILAERRGDFALENVSEIRRDPDIGITIFMKNGGLEARLGFGPYGEKTGRLETVFRKLRDNGWHEGLIYLNLECVPRVTAGYLKGSSPREKSGEIETEEEELPPPLEVVEPLPL